MSTINDSSPLTKEACYNTIASIRCEMGASDGIAGIVDLILKELFQEIEKTKNISFSKPLKDRVIEEIGKELNTYITREYTTNLIDLYKVCLNDLSIEEINQVAQNPTGDIFCSESHKKFHLREKLSVLPIKSQLIVKLIQNGKTLIKSDFYMNRIYNILGILNS